MRDPSPSSPPAPDGERSPRRRPRRRAGIASVVVLVLLAALATGAAVYFTGRPIPAPLWVQERIEARIATALPQARVDFGAMEFVVDKPFLAVVSSMNQSASRYLNLTFYFKFFYI